MGAAKSAGTSGEGTTSNRRERPEKKEREKNYVSNNGLYTCHCYGSPDHQG